MRTAFKTLILLLSFSVSLSGQIPSTSLDVSKPFYLENWFWTFIIFSFLACLFSLYKWRVKRLERRQIRLQEEVKKRTEIIEKDKEIILAQAEALKELDRNKTRFFANIAHEIRTPLTLITGPLQQLIEEQVPASRTQKRLSDISSNAQLLLQMTNQLLDISKLENGKLKTSYSFGDIKNYTHELVSRFAAAAENKNVFLKNIQFSNPWEINFDTDQWSKIIHNLLSNAIKFTDAGGSVEVLLSDFEKDSESYISLLVKDSGIGMSSEQVNKIYNRFYQVDSSSTRERGGSGIGLSLVKELVELQGGEIYVSSKVGVGTKFRILLPVKEKTQRTSIDTTENQALPYSTTPNSQPSPNTPCPKKENDKRLNILIVEDNAGMRYFIKSCLDSEKFNIHEAENGEIGLEKAFSELPDLIVSDLMMPKKDGYELTRELRSNRLTSHIPIILLTAKVGDENRMKGLELGVDAYLSKPFNARELTLRIENLLNFRERIHYRYANPEKFPQDGNQQVEDEFLVQIRNFVLDNIETSNLNGDVVGKHIGMSRVHLHRKLKAVTGKPITEFVKNVRLEKAMEMIQEKKWNVSEVTHKTGFSSISHFSRSFKQAYGKAPSEI